MHLHSIASGLAALAALAAPAAGQSLTTFYSGLNQGNVGGGIYFDLNVTSPTGITILQIDLNAGPIGGPGGVIGTLDVLTIPGTRVGSQTNVSAWTGPSSLGNAVTTAAHNTATACPITPIFLPTGSHGVAFRANGFAHSYTNGAGGNQIHGNADLVLTAGEASNVAFTGSLFSPRVVNCTIHYATTPPGNLLATATPYGAGCVTQPDACFYENFSLGRPFDLGSSTMTLIHTGAGYLALPGFTTFQPPSANAATLALTDNSEVTVQLAAPLRHGRASTTSALTICSNGFVAVGAGNGTSGVPSVAQMLNSPKTAWYCWHDYNPAALGSGQVRFEQIGGVAYVTWQGVFDFGSVSPSSASTFQFQFELATGHVHYAWQQMSGGGNGFLVGFSEAGPSADPGITDLSAVLPLAFPAATFAVQPLHLAAAARPILGATIQLTTSQVTANTAFGAIALGLAPLATPIDLTSVGMPGCARYFDILATVLFLPLGQSSVATPFTVPPMLGLHVHAQSFAYDPMAMLTPLGAVASRALDLHCGDW